MISITNFYILLCSFIMILANITVKYYKNSGIPIGLVFYSFLLYFSIKIYEKENMAISYISMHLFAIIGMTLASFYLFKEDITLYNLIGIILSIIAIIFMKYNRFEK